MKRIVLFTAVALISISGGLYFGSQRWETSPASEVKTNILFAQNIPDIQNQPQALSQWKDKTLVVNFWATWCAPCVEEMPELAELQTEIASKNMQIIGIGIDSDKNIKEFAAKHNINYPLYIAGMGGSDLAKQMGNQAGGLPFTVLIMPDGQVKQTYLGRLDMKELRKDLGLL